MRAAVLDLGSTSFQLVVADVDAATITVLARDREMLRLGAAVGTHGRVPASSIAAAIEVVDRFRRGAVLAGADIVVAVATAALRDADNGDELLAALATAAGAPIRLLEGEAEARLALNGMRAGVPGLHGPILGIDLGGGSLDLALSSRGSKPGPAASLPLGAVRLQGELRISEVLARRDRRAIARRVREELEGVGSLGGEEWNTSLATGGVVGAIARIVLAARGGWLPSTPNAAVITRADLEWVRDSVGEMTLDQRLGLGGMEARRADVVPVGAAVLAEVAAVLEIDGFVISEWGLREGVLLEANGITSLPTIDVARSATVDRLVADCNADDAHGRQVAGLAVGLFDQLRRSHRLSPADRALLECGARLHDLGARVANGGHHKHGAYLVEHATLRGFDPEEAAMLACLVRFHKGSGPRPSYEPYAGLPDAAQRSVDWMTAMLHVADGLDRGRDQCVAETRANRSGGRVVITVDGPGDIGLACWAAEQKSSLLAGLMGVPVTLRPAPLPLAATATS